MGWLNPPAPLAASQVTPETCWQAADRVLAEYAIWRRRVTTGQSSADPFWLTDQIDRLLTYRYAHGPQDPVDELELVRVLAA